MQPHVYHQLKILMKRKLTMRLSRAHPGLQLHIYGKQAVAKGNHHQHVKQREFMGKNLCSHLLHLNPTNSRKKSVPVSVHVRI